MDYKIEKLLPSQVDVVGAMVEECGRDMEARLGLTHWSPPYPMHYLRRDAVEKSVYAVRDGEMIKATFTISARPAAYYDIDLWADPRARAAYVSRVAVPPVFQGKGIGTWCMGAVESMAAKSGFKTGRLDAYGKHKQTLAFYEKLGYVRRGVVHFGELELVCFEKELENPSPS